MSNELLSLDHSALGTGGLKHFAPNVQFPFAMVSEKKFIGHRSAAISQLSAVEGVKFWFLLPHNNGRRRAAAVGGISDRSGGAG